MNTTIEQLSIHTLLKLMNNKVVEIEEDCEELLLLREKVVELEKDYEEAVRYADDQIEQLEREKAKLEREFRQYKAIRVSAVRQKIGLQYHVKFAHTRDWVLASTMHLADRSQFIDGEMKSLSYLENVAYRISMHLSDLFTYEEALSLLISRIKDLGYENDVAIEIEDRFESLNKRVDGRIVCSSTISGKTGKPFTRIEIRHENNKEDWVVLPQQYTDIDAPHGKHLLVAMSHAIGNIGKLFHEADEIFEQLAEGRKLKEEEPVKEEDDNLSPEQAWENFKNGIKAMQKLCRDVVQAKNSHEAPEHRFPVYPSSVPSWNCYEVAWGSEDDERDYGDGKPTKKDIMSHPDATFSISFKFVDPNNEWPDKLVETVFNAGRWEAEVRSELFYHKDSTPFKNSTGKDYYLEGQK